MSVCSARKDFLRQIVNKAISESSGKISASVMEDLKVRFTRAEDKFSFSAFGGDPRRIADFLSSEEWADIVEYAKNVNVTWLLEAILKKLAEEYKEDCPPIANKALETLNSLKGSTIAKEEPTLDSIVRKLKFYGFKVNVIKEDEREHAEIEQPLLKVKLYVSEGKINYVMCREGKVSTVDALIALMEKVRE
ncbi:MAG: hypothetical protein ACO2OZ_03030 [Acidilobaceae archaeon]